LPAACKGLMASSSGRRDSTCLGRQVDLE
jgi:hypothetical protein